MVLLRADDNGQFSVAKTSWQACNSQTGTGSMSSEYSSRENAEISNDLIRKQAAVDAAEKQLHQHTRLLQWESLDDKRMWVLDTWQVQN